MVNTSKNDRVRISIALGLVLIVVAAIALFSQIPNWVALVSGIIALLLLTPLRDAKPHQEPIPTEEGTSEH